MRTEKEKRNSTYGISCTLMDKRTLSPTAWFYPWEQKENRAFSKENKEDRMSSKKDRSGSGPESKLRRAAAS